MRLKGSVAFFGEERDKALLKAFRKKLAECKGGVNLSDVVADVINSPTTQFWVSFDRATIMVQKIRSGQDLSMMGRTRLEMFKEIERRVSEIERANPGIKLDDAVIMAVESQAPKFYLTVKSAKVILHKIKKKWREGRLVI